MLRKKDYTDFQKACTDGDLKRIEELAEKARASGGKAALRSLLEKGESLGFRNACANGQLDVFNKLVELGREAGGKGLLVSMLEAKNFDAFHRATDNDHADIVKAIIELGKDLDNETAPARRSTMNRDFNNSGLDSGYGEYVAASSDPAPSSQAPVFQPA